MSLAGDLEANDAFDANDVDMLATKTRSGYATPRWLPDAAFDMNGDNRVSREDHQAWVKDITRTWFGDADLNGEFNSADFVHVFQVGEYETGQVKPWGEIVNPTGWAEGDWNGDGLFDSADLVTALIDGGYEQGPRTDVAPVPEPAAVLLLILGLVAVLQRRPAA